MNQDIVLSICIASYNRRDLVCEHVKKILRYEGNDIEVIVNDNASEDGTIEALEKLDDKRLRVYKNEINVGAGGNHTRTIMYATGKYVIIINERDWIEPEGIRSFIAIYKDCECDAIMAIGGGDKKLFKKNASRIEGRAFLICLFTHPGLRIIRKETYKELVEKVKEKEIKEYTDEWILDFVRQEISLLIYAKKWECFTQLVKQPKPNQLARIVQLRGESNAERLFFTHEGRIERFGKVIDNPYIRSEDRRMYIRGVYRCGVHCRLWRYYRERKNPERMACLMERYQWEPEQSVSWIKVAIRFYKGAIKILKEKKLYTRQLAKDMVVITVEEYIMLYLRNVIFIATSIKKTFFPKPWLKN